MKNLLRLLKLLNVQNITDSMEGLTKVGETQQEEKQHLDPTIQSRTLDDRKEPTQLRSYSEGRYGLPASSDLSGQMSSFSIFHST